ncbi:MAG: DUF3306 domain-containing protein [Pseudomonadota bacterium]
MTQDEKGDDKNFLSRWSQRKQEAKQPELDNASVKQAEGAELPPAPMAESETEEEFDLSSLPKLEDVTETTDITGFLRKGVPESLRNAALRKSWALDPAIRNYVNPALDYAYDWNTPGGVPGNSEIAAGTDIAKMVLQIMGSDSSADPVESAPQAPNVLHHSDAPDVAKADAGADAAQNRQPNLPLQQVRLSESTTDSTPVMADRERVGHVQVENTHGAETGKPSALQHELRRHGTAKPKV